MNHKNIKKQLFLYLDGEISEEKAAEIHRHLQECEECRVLSEIWQNEKRHTQRLAAPPYLWTHIESALQQPAPFRWFDQIITSTRPFMQPVVVAITFILMVFVGIQIGEGMVNRQPQKNTQIHQEFRMDYFTTVPSGSIGEELVILKNRESEVRP